MSQVLCINEGTSRMVNLIQKRIRKTEIHMFKKGKRAEMFAQLEAKQGNKTITFGVITSAQTSFASLLDKSPQVNMSEP